MPNFFKYKKSHVLCAALLLPLAVNAASYNDTNTIGDDPFDLGSDLLSFDAEQDRQKQAMEQVKHNYLSVIDLVKKKNYSDAKTKVTELIQQEPKQSIYYNLQALLQLVDKDRPAAEQSFVKAVELNPKNTQALTGLAKLALDSKQWDKAKQYADKVLAVNPYEVKAYQVLADVAMNQQGIEAVESLLLDAQNKLKDKPAAELAIAQSLAKVYLKQKQPEKLLPLASDLIKRNPNDNAALSFLAEAQLINKDPVGAEKTLRQIIAQQPNDSKHRFLLARLLGQQADKENEILSLLDKAAENIANPALVLSYKTAILLKQKHFQQALAVAQQVDETNPTLAIGKILKGDVYLSEKKLPEALSHYQQAYAITPNIKVLDAILKILARQNKPKEAIALLEKELTKKADNTAIQFRLAERYQSSQQNDLATKHYEAVLIKQKDNVIVLNNLAYLYQQQNNPKAIELAKHAYQLAPKSGAIADTYGYILLKQGDKSQGLTILKQAAELNPQLVEIQLHLAEAYIANQDKEQGKAILEKIINNKSAKPAELKQAKQGLLEL